MRAQEGHRNCIYFDVKKKKKGQHIYVDTFGYIYVAKKALNWHVWENETKLCVHFNGWFCFPSLFYLLSLYAGMWKEKKNIYEHFVGKWNYWKSYFSDFLSSAWSSAKKNEKKKVWSMQQMQRKWHKNNKRKNVFVENWICFFFQCGQRNQDEMPKNSHSQFDKGMGSEICVLKWKCHAMTER